eukprot:scaffold126392_cov22-Prasinocladus_malaysianus.AAC.1
MARMPYHGRPLIVGPGIIRVRSLPRGTIGGGPDGRGVAAVGARLGLVGRQPLDHLRLQPDESRFQVMTGSSFHFQHSHAALREIAWRSLELLGLLIGGFVIARLFAARRIRREFSSRLLYLPV